MVRLAVVLAIGALGATSGPAAPAAHEACASCHAGPGVAASDGRIDGELTCLRCHADQRTGRDFRPASIERAHAGHPTTCVSCHDPHAGTSRLLRRPEGRAFFDGDLDATSVLCVGCHEKQGQWRGWSSPYRRHPVGVPVVGPRPAVGPELVLPLIDIRDTPDPRDDVIACITCHDVHTATDEHLLRWWKREVIAACTACHAVNGEPRGAELLAWMRQNGRNGDRIRNLYD